MKFNESDTEGSLMNLSTRENIVLALVALAFFGRSETSVDETGALLMQKTRDSQMQAAPDSVEMPNLEGVLERLKPEEGE